MKKYILFNWKMYLDLEESRKLASELKTLQIGNNLEVAVFPTNLALTAVKEEFNNTNIFLGAQNITWAPKGAYTGEVSALMFKDAGAKYGLIGHSERRYVFGESDTDIKKKISASLDAGLKVALCIGETQEDRDEGKMAYRLKKQLMVLEGLNVNNENLVIAYEPVWAISKSGVGVPCLPVDAVDATVLIKQELSNYSDTQIPVLYGGSVLSNNVESYWKLSEMDGVLVGSAGTKSDEFKKIIELITKS